MKGRPILFSAPMVRALLAGTKTQTRRALRPQPVDQSTGCDLPAGARPDSLPACPYGVPGDRLWVRETWGLRKQLDITDWYRGPIGGASEQEWTVDFRADYGPNQEQCFWRPSIYMPRWASRIVLELTSVRVERLHAITPADAIAEGVVSLAAYRSLWDDINGAGAWRLNPWVWVLGLRRVTP